MSFKDLMKLKIDNSKNNNRKQSNKRFYMLFLSYKILKKILNNPNVSDRELKLINSRFSRELITLLVQKKYVVSEKIRNSSNEYTKPKYNITIEGMVFIDFIDSYLTDLGLEPYKDHELITNETQKEELWLTI